MAETLSNPRPETPKPPAPEAEAAKVVKKPEKETPEPKKKTTPPEERKPEAPEGQPVFEEMRHSLQEHKRRLTRVIPKEIQNKPIADQLAYLAKIESHKTVGVLLSEASKLMRHPSAENIEALKIKIEGLKEAEIAKEAKEVYLLLLKNGALEAAQKAGFTEEGIIELAGELEMYEVAAQQAPDWLFTEADIAGFPANAQEFIHNINDTIQYSPLVFTQDYIKEKISELDRLNGQVRREDKQEIKKRLNERKEKIEEETEKEQTERYLERLVESDESKALGYDGDDVKFLHFILPHPQRIEEELRKGVADLATAEERQKKLQENFEKFQENLKRIFDHLFNAAAQKRDVPFQESWNYLIHGRVHGQIFSTLDTAKNYFLQQEREREERGKKEEIIKVKILVKEEKDYEVKPKEVKLSEALGITHFRLSEEDKLRRYNHNVNYAIGLEAPLKNITDYAQQLQADNIDVLFLEDPFLQSACHFYLQELKKESADNFWIMGTTWLQENPQGKVIIEERVKERTRDYAQAKGKILTERDLNRIISLASGTLFGITAEGFDVLSQNKPPPLGSQWESAGYFASGILPNWNLEHLFARFGIPGKMAELFYLKVMKGGTLSKWDHRRLEAEMKEDKNKLKTGLLWALSGGPPLIEVMSKNFGIRGILSRGGWRILTWTSHHLISREGKPLLITPFEIDDWEAKDLAERIANEINWENIDWEKSFANLERVGSGVMFSFWIDERAEWEAKGEVKKLGLEGKAKEKKQEELKKGLQKKYCQEYLEKVRTRNPLIFLHYDLAQSYKESLRYQVLSNLEEFKGRKDNYEAIRGEVDQIERDLMLVVEKITEGDKDLQGRRVVRWKDEDSDWEVIPEEGGRRERAKKYWEELKKQIKTKHQVKVEGKTENLDYIDETYEKMLKEKYFFFGSEDMDFREIAFREAGFNALKRSFRDINALAEAAKEFHGLSDKLIAAAEAKDYKDLIKTIYTICHSIEGIHGLESAQKMCYYLTTITSRYFGKSWWARLPAGIGTVANFILQSSLSEKVGGKRAWQWDEETSSSFINDVRLTGYLATEGDFSINTLRAEVGARNIQMVYDLLRTAVPLIIFLIMLQGGKEETKS